MSTSFSHRDRRAHRTVWRALAGIAAGTLALSASVMWASPIVLALAALIGLALVGGTALLAGEEALREYERDLRAVSEGAVVAGFVRAEVRSDVGLERPVGLPSTRSPHARPRAYAPDPWPAALPGR